VGIINPFIFFISDPGLDPERNDKTFKTGMWHSPEVNEVRRNELAVLDWSNQTAYTVKSSWLLN